MLQVSPAAEPVQSLIVATKAPAVAVPLLAKFAMIRSVLASYVGVPTKAKSGFAGLGGVVGGVVGPLVIECSLPGTNSQPFYRPQEPGFRL